MRFGERLNKPEYFFRPAQSLCRLVRSWRPCPTAPVTVVLPWGLPLRILPGEDIGRQIWLLGVFDLSLTETLWRLTDPGDTAIDVGANIGYTASILAVRAGNRGRVMVFEPHPALFDELTYNLNQWRTQKPAPVISYRLALSDRRGTCRLMIPDQFIRNRGVAALSDSSGKGSTPVSTDRFDNLIATSAAVGIVKVDVEGHELKVLLGMKELLARQRIRDIVFEEADPYPTAVTELLEAHGYKIFSLGVRVFGPVIRMANHGSAPRRSWAAPNLVATVEPDRAVARFKSWGWKSLRGSP